MRNDTRVTDFRLTRFQKLLIIFLVDLVAVFVPCYGIEYYLRLTDPFLNKKVPFDSMYYAAYQPYYDHLTVPDVPADWADNLRTWGHVVINNRFSFRERNFAVPKPAGVCRIIVLGDSFTWGTGLEVEERYTNLAEVYLNKAFSQNNFEVLNFGWPGKPTVFERDTLRTYKNLVQPDLVVVAFVYNDPQQQTTPRSKWDEFDRQYGPLLDSLSGGMTKLGLPLTARLMREAIENIIVKMGLVTSWLDDMQRAYEPDSPEWSEFIQALQDIKTMSDEMRLPTPLLLVLNHALFPDYPTDYQVQDQTLPIDLRWLHQGQQAAAKIGYRTYNFEDEFSRQLTTPAEIPINQLDGHPGPKVNQIYAHKLFELIAVDTQNGKLCAYHESN